MLLIRGIAALGVSAIIATGTLVAVNHNTDKATETAKEITQQSLDYQREAQKAAQDVTAGTKSAEDASAELQANADELVANANDAAAEAIDSVDDSVAIPDEAKKQLEAAKAQLEQK